MDISEIMVNMMKNSGVDIGSESMALMLVTIGWEKAKKNGYSDWEVEPWIEGFKNGAMVFSNEFVEHLDGNGTLASKYSDDIHKAISGGLPLVEVDPWINGYFTAVESMFNMAAAVMKGGDKDDT